MEDPGVQLPLEIIDHIISQVVISIDHDPAYQWSTLRHISARYMYMIEQYFESFWLPKLCITANHTAWYTYDYHLVEEETCQHSFARFEIKRTIENLASSCAGRWDIQTVLSNLWHNYSFSNKNVFLRVGEGDPLCTKGPRGGYFINDTDLHELTVGESGLRIRFNWKRTFDCFFREEIMMRDRQRILTAAAIAKLRKKNEWSDVAPLAAQIQTLLPELVGKIQQHRRFHVQMSRSLDHDSSARTMSSYLSEPVPLVDLWDLEGTVDPYKRQSTVTLF